MPPKQAVLIRRFNHLLGSNKRSGKLIEANVRCCVELTGTALRRFWSDDSEYLKNGTSERKDEANSVPSHKDVLAGRSSGSGHSHRVLALPSWLMAGMFPQVVGSTGG